MNCSKRFALTSIATAVSVSLSVATLSPVWADDDERSFSASNGWPMSSYDYANTNFNPKERTISRRNVGKLKRAWETFNDDAFVPTPPPSGFMLEPMLGLHYPSSVVGVVSPPVIHDGTIYYIDELGTLFARDAKTGGITDSRKHWTTTLVDPDYAQGNPPLMPSLFFSAVAITATHVWINSSVYGQLHAVERDGGKEVDFDPTTRDIEPYRLVPDRMLSSIMGNATIVKTDKEHGSRTLWISGVDIIINEVLVQGRDTGMIVAIDITDPAHPFEAWRTRTIDINPATGVPYGTGVSADSGLAVDTKRHLIFGGTGQNTTEPYPGYPDVSKAPAGYVDRGDSLWAIDYHTGQFVWHNQFHNADVFNPNAPVSTGPNPANGGVDADVMAPPVLFTAQIKTRDRDAHGHERDRTRKADLVGNGSKGGIYRVVDRDTGQTVWQRTVSKQTGIGGIQGGSAYANGSIYVAGFEGIDDGFSDAIFGMPGSKFPNAFIATFSPAFWADAEDVRDDGDVSTGMRTKVYKFDAATGKSQWRFRDGRDYVELRAGASMRHVSVANGVVYVTTTSGQIFAIDDDTGEILFHDQSPDLNEVLRLGLGKPHHASMNAGALIADGMVYVPYGGQNNPSGGIIAYKLGDRKKSDRDD